MIPMDKKTVVVGMSGGVDSSVSAVLLKEAGYNVIGMFMKNWEEQNADGECQSASEYADVMRVCDQIGIPYYSVNFVKEYWDNVFQHFLRELEQGYTPNPDILCNREIKFKVLLEKAKEVGGDFLATGHYCRSAHVDGAWQLLKGRDSGKDQSYFLYTIGQYPLSKVLFPIGDLLKSQVRDIARKHNLATSEKKDSTGICFIGERKIKDFLSKYIAYKPGNLVTLDGTVVGKHEGLAYYTIGQRRGMGLGGAGDAWYVVGKDIDANAVVVERGDMHPALYCDYLTATEPSWVQGIMPQLPLRCTCKIRYRQTDQDCVITGFSDGVLRVEFPVPQRAVTPRQSIVFYSGDVCLGGALIEKAGPSYYQQGRPLGS
jgi:tRNA-specific 2-thiouridylase